MSEFQRGDIVLCERQHYVPGCVKGKVYRVEQIYPDQPNGGTSCWTGLTIYDLENRETYRNIMSDGQQGFNANRFKLLQRVPHPDD